MEAIGVPWLSNKMDQFVVCPFPIRLKQAFEDRNRLVESLLVVEWEKLLSTCKDSLHLIPYTSYLRQERIALPFFPHRRLRPVPREQPGVIRQGQHLGVNAGEQGFVTGAGQVGAPDASLEDHVAAEQNFGAGAVEHNVPKGVSRGKAHFHRHTADR
jgi:hypothetical protein